MAAISDSNEPTGAIISIEGKGVDFMGQKYNYAGNGGRDSKIQRFKGFKNSKTCLPASAGKF